MSECERVLLYLRALKLHELLKGNEKFNAVPEMEPTVQRKQGSNSVCRLIGDLRSTRLDTGAMQL
jgi:hypothetical protein